jgi:cytochrome P450
MSSTRESGRPASDYEYPSPAVIECPYAFYGALRDGAPVHRLPDGTHLVSRYEDVVRVARSPLLYSNMIGPLNDQILGGPRVGGDASGPWPAPFVDGKQHRLQRAFCSLLVAPERMRWFEPRIERLVDELIDGFAGAGRVEFRSAFAGHLPRRVMMETFGFPRSDEADIIRWTSGQGPVGAKLASPEQQAAEQQRRLELGEYLRQKIHARLDQPTDDFLTEIVGAQVARDGTLDEPYLLSEVANLFAAGNLTTAHMIASTMLLLVEHPAELERVRADRSLLPAMLEESMRLESPVQWLQRIVTEDTELGGVQLEAGSMLLVMWGAANRDERQFDEPDRFVIDRPRVAREQTAFGFGVHRCVGVPLARVEGRIAFDRLLDRLPNLRLVGDAADVTHIPNMNQRAPVQVHVAFDPS